MVSDMTGVGGGWEGRSSRAGPEDRIYGRLRIRHVVHQVDITKKCGIVDERVQVVFGLDNV